jgi:hypothetical protein
MTLHYIPQGVPFDVVEVIGRWAPNARRKHLREHAEILSAHLQHREEAVAALASIAIPTNIR